MLKRLRFWLAAWRFRRAYRRVASKSGELRIIAACIKEAFCAHTEARVSVTSAALPKAGYTFELETTICWEAPAIFLVAIDGRPAFGMGIEFGRESVSIRQLHGQIGATFEAGLRSWPRIFVEAAIEYARLRDLASVRLYRAHTDLFYAEPFVPKETGRGLEQAREDIRRRMRRRYDGTARQMKLRMFADWAEWSNPDRA